MELSSSVEIEVDVARGVAFEYLTTAYHEFLLKRGLFPAVTSVEIHGDGLEAGARRTIGLSDGGVLEEEIRLHDPPTVHSYRWRGGVKFPNSLMVAAGSSIWRFAESTGRTRVDWTYTFELTSPLWWPIARIMMWGYRRWMQRGLRLAKSHLEAEATS